MCGIFGVWERDGGVIDVARVEAAVSSMRHRGPDDEGYVLIDIASGRAVPCGGDDTHPSLGLRHIREFKGERFDLALGHRRLAILDTSPAGHQPMTDGRNWIVHSGEVFNFESLRDRFVKRGRSFRTRSDTEVLLAMWAREAEEMMGPDVDGMWGLAVWDAGSRRLFCSRDRFGVKPFQYSVSDGRFVFASEAKAIFAYTGERPAEHTASVADYLAWGMTDHRPETFFEGVRSLDPGCSLLVDATGERIERYWSLEQRGTAAPVWAGKPSNADLLAWWLRRSVEARLRSDVPVGALLSGGLDSSTISCLARQAMGLDADLRTFTAGFDDPSIDERRFSDEVARATGADQHVVVADGTALLETLPALMRHQEAPVISSSICAQWQVMELANASGVTVLLDGQGGDELLSGYPQAFELHLRRLVRRGRVFRAAREAATADVGGAFRRALARTPSRVRRSPAWIDPAAVSSDEPWRYPPGASLREVMANDIRYRLPSLLRFEERNSMALGLETRVPFLEHGLVGFAYERLTDRDRIRGGLGKAVLRDAMRGVVPDVVLDRRDKIGFRTPEREWLLGENRSKVEERILSGPVPGLPFIRADELRRVLAEGWDTTSIWRWLCLTAWMREFL